MIDYRNNCYKFNKSGTCYWFTGLQCSGKTTVAKRFCELHSNFILLDGDAIRTSINYDLGFNDKDVTTNLTKVANLCVLLLDQGYNVCVSCVSKNKQDRLLAKTIIERNSFNYFEVFCYCNEYDILNRRKSLHKNTKILFNDYEQSDYNVLQLNTSEMTIDKCLERLKNAN